MSGGSHGHYCQNRNPKPWRMPTAVSISWARERRSITLFFSPGLACLFFLLMDLVSPTEQLCYVRCTYCNTVLAVGIPCKRMMDTITVKCGHCNHLSFLGPRPIVQSLTPTNHHLIGLQGPCTDCLRGQPSPPSSTTSIEQMIQSPQFVMKPPEKKHRMPSAYNRFMKEEIQRIKADKPDIPHREAFSMAAKNWAKCDPRCSSTIVSPSDTNELAPVPDSERSSCSRMESSSVCKQLEKKD